MVKKVADQMETGVRVKGKMGNQKESINWNGS